MIGADKLNSAQVQLRLEQQHTQQYNFLFRGRRVLYSGGQNHVNPRVYFTWAYESISPSNNEPQWTVLVVD
jgi:hypothetical protein